MKLLTVAFLCFIAVLGSGCASMRAPTAIHPIESADKPTFIDLDATRRGYVIIPRPDKKGYLVLGEPAPDAALATVDRILAEASLKSTAAGGTPLDVKAELEFRTAIVQLAQKSQSILFLREALYRISELAVNGAISQEQVAKLYDEAILTSLKMAETELAKQKANQAKEEANLARLLSDPAVQGIWKQVFGDLPECAGGGTTVKPVQPQPPHKPVKKDSPPSDKH